MCFLVGIHPCSEPAGKLQRSLQSELRPVVYSTVVLTGLRGRTGGVTSVEPAFRKLDGRGFQMV